MRTPIDQETKIKMQALYDERKKVEEKCVRVVAYVKSYLVDKIEKLAYEEKCTSDDVINELLNDELL